MSATSRRSGGGPAHEAELVLLWIAIGLFVLVGGAVTGAAHLGARIDNVDQPLPTNPFELVIGLVDGSVAWPASATLALIVLAVALTILATLVGVLIARSRRRRSRVDRASRWMGRGRDLTALRRRGAEASAARLGIEQVGLPIARTVAGGELLYSSWEDVSVDVWGPRTGKSTSRAIPAILDAPGAVLATSNKRDLVDATRDLRAARGEVWVFDPQSLVDEPVAWWWNPLSYVTDEVKASILADIFASAGRDPNARTDAYFEPAAQDLLANLLLAAALDERPITQVYLWLAEPTEDEAVHILRGRDYPLLASALQAVVNAPEKQRGGVYGTAQQFASFMTNRQAMRWVTPPAEPAPAPRGPGANPWLTPAAPAGVREFSPDEFVRSKGALYSLSKEGRGSAGPLVTALTVAVTEAAEEYAKRQPGGRLATPMVVVLDEAANVCRWRELPNLYSHYGSRGICMMTILQSWSQGVEVWGRDGMRKLWSAANVKVYGGGVSEVEFLSELSQLIGDFDLDTISVSHGKGGRSTSRATRRERVLDVSDLGAMPRGRAVVFASGAPAVLVSTIPWMSGPHAEAVRASIRAHDPAAEQTLDALAGAAAPEGAPASREASGAAS
jgi:type IV secretory pathway TraG/TraD family ATPase VirD4